MSGESIYFLVKIKVETIDEKGRVKYKNEPYIVQGINPTDVEKKINEELSAADFEIVSITATKIVDILK